MLFKYKMVVIFDSVSAPQVLDSSGMILKTDPIMWTEAYLTYIIIAIYNSLELKQLDYLITDNQVNQWKLNQ